MTLSINDIESYAFCYLRKHAQTYDLTSSEVAESVHEIALEVYLECEGDFTYANRLTTSFCSKYVGNRFSAGERETLKSGRAAYRHYFTLPLLGTQIKTLHECSMIKHADLTDAPQVDEVDVLSLLPQHKVAKLKHLHSTLSYTKFRSRCSKLTDSEFDQVYNKLNTL